MRTSRNSSRSFHMDLMRPPPSLQTPVYAIFPFPTLACASILLSTREHGVALPEGWHELFDSDMDDMMSVCGYIVRLYRQRSDADIARWMKLALGGKKAVRKWLEENGRP